MRRYDPDQPLISLHVPKCGGSSFRAILQEWFGRNFHLHYIDEATNRLPAKYPLRRPRRFWRYRPRLVIHGHFNRARRFGVPDYYPGVRQFITILRDPFEVAVSRYFYAKKLGDRHLVGGAVRPISAEFPDVNAYLEANLDHDFFPAYFPRPLTPASLRDYLDRHFVYIGIMEDYQTSVDCLAQRLGVPSVTVPLANVSARDEPVDAGLEAAFRDRHVLDYALYRYAQDHYRA